MRSVVPPDATALARSSATPEVDIHWYRDAVIYQLHVKSFFDSNNDGIGDFAGLAGKLDYIAELGATAIWLLPFYPSPRLDDGYDIADYRGVHPDYGTLADVKRLIAEAHARGLRVITELVLNHTSDQHPWFQRARRAKSGSVYRDFYVWSDTDKKYAETRIIFIDSEKSNWAWDEKAKAYYWHRFYQHQPDLNFDNPRVIREILSVLRYWVELGIDGLRLDAVPYLIERDGTSNENLPETHTVLKRIRSELDLQYPGRILLAEANQWPEDTKDYFGDGDECHMAFHFPLMPRMYMAIAQEDRFPITDILRQTPEIPLGCQWATFLRNHDELTLEMVTESERDFLWETYAADKRARLNLGIRRRLAPLMERDRSRVELMNYLLLSMIGTPVIYYGDEIGMGDNIHLGDRNGVRTPMQWSSDRNGGFSRVADPSKLVLPLVVDPLYSYQTVNVESQAADQHSLLMWMRRAIAIRKQNPVFGRGRLRLLYPENRKVLAYLREDDDGGSVLCVANLARTPQAFELDLAEFVGVGPIELHGRSKFPTITRFPYVLTLPAHGFYWFSLLEAEESPTPHPATPMSEMYTLVIRTSLIGALKDARQILERDILGSWLQGRRWFGMKETKLQSINITSCYDCSFIHVAILEVETSSEGHTQDVAKWQVPLGVIWDPDRATSAQLEAILARVRRGAMVGIATDAFSIPEFAIGILQHISNDKIIVVGNDTINFKSLDVIMNETIDSQAPLRWISGEQSNSTVVFDNRIVIKLLRRISTGIHPEVEMGRFLSECRFKNAPKLLGEVYRARDDGSRETLIIVQEFVRNQGDAWNWTVDFLIRRISEFTAGDDSAGQHLDTMEEYKEFAHLLGRRIAEMHLALASRTDVDGFSPVVITDNESAQVAQNIIRQFDQMLYTLDVSGQEAFQMDIRRLASRRQALVEHVRMIAGALKGSIMSRIHGDLHLGQILIAGGEISILDFEGEPTAPLVVRRGRYSPIRDVAGLIRSFDYAGETTKQRVGISHSHLAGGSMDRFIDTFKTIASNALLSGYKSTYEEHNELTVAETAPGTLNLFLIEKSVYEVIYELVNRPSWVNIPLRAVSEQIRKLVGDFAP